ncbi:glycerophosphodiester phosphodiesterase [soil metagenome]
MFHNHPVLPNHRPLAIAHRAGNDLDRAAEAIADGADMLETDIWPFHGRLEVRHTKTIGPLPIYWEKWYIDSIGGRQMHLAELLEGTPVGAQLFLDLKGRFPRLGHRVVRAIQRIQPEREMVICGRSWRQLDAIATVPNVHIFYSVGDEDELAQVWSKLESRQNRAVSINHGLLTEETVARLNDLGTTIIAWTVNDPAVARTLFELGVDGFTTDNRELLTQIVRFRERAFDTEAMAELPEEPNKKGDE